MGLEWARPGMGVFHAMFSDLSAFQDTGVLNPSATPDAAGPRNVGQFCASAGEARSRQKQKTTIRFTGTPFNSPDPVRARGAGCLQGRVCEFIPGPRGALPGTLLLFLQRLRVHAKNRLSDHCFASTRLNTNSFPRCFKVRPVIFPASSLNFMVTLTAPAGLAVVLSKNSRGNCCPPPVPISFPSLTSKVSSPAASLRYLPAYLLRVSASTAKSAFGGGTAPAAFSRSTTSVNFFFSALSSARLKVWGDTFSLPRTNLIMST